MLAGVALATVLSVIAWWPRPLPRHPVPDPRLTYQSPFKNVHPDIGYVGTAVCAGCHVDLADTYKKHPMGRSLEPFVQRTPLEKFGAGPRNPFSEGGLRYLTTLTDGLMVQREECLGEDGAPALVAEARPQFAVGSGRRARSYLTATDGFLCQAPITWYAALDGWGLSPGYAVKHQHFHRKIDPRCLFCHANGVTAVASHGNRYPEPIFKGHAIGCERCHGPGALHTARLDAEKPVEGAFDDTIVNPKHLPADLAEAVCQQCHLEGDARFLRRGREAFEYRPGLPLYPFWANFEAKTEAGAPKFVGHVEQMHGSKCYTASGGALRCVSCHDPHQLPAPEKKAEWHRGRCAVCHDGQVGKPLCAEPREKRLKASPADDCVQCHMPKKAADQIVHASISDHRIPRKPDQQRQMARFLDDGPLLDFFREVKDEALYPQEERQRDRGIALMELVRFDQGADPRTQAAARLTAQRALPLLDGALARWPDDLAAREARATALILLGRNAEALADAEAALRYLPDHEAFLSLAGWLAGMGGDYRESARRYERAMTVNPRDPEPAVGRARALAALDRWPEAENFARQSLRLNPMGLEARKTLVAALLQQGKRGEAAAEFKRLLALKPPDAAALKAWFAAQR